MQKYASRDCVYLKLTPEERRKNKIKETYAAIHGRSTNYANIQPKIDKTASDSSPGLAKIAK